MVEPANHRNVPYRELLFQLVLHIVVFIFFVFDRNTHAIKLHHVIFFLEYTVTAGLINYWLLPRYFYRKNYLFFFLWLVVLVTLAIVIEEMVLEQIFFPDTRGKNFPGIFLSLLYFMPVVIILVGCKFGWDALHKQRELDQLKVAIQESELQFLKSQINPHFLFNNLNNLYSYAIEQSPKTPEIILELSAFLRYMLYECSAKYVSLQKELEQMGNYIRLNELQIEERGEVSYRVGDIPAGHLIAPLILIVFIENAFKHSTGSQSDNIQIEVGVEMDDDNNLHFHCSNSYLPENNTERLDRGIGLANARKRLDLLYPERYTLDIKNSDNLYRVDLYIELQTPQAI